MIGTKTVSFGFPVSSILLTVFVLAKVFGVAPVAVWSWFWVFSPVWIPLGVLAVICICIMCARIMCALMAMIATALEK
jgi:hypothetical protein